MMTRKDMAQILAVLGVSYPRQAIRADVLKLTTTVWLDLLGDIPLDQIKLAVHHHCTNSQWFPSVAEIRQAAFDLGESESDRLTAGDAWAEVQDQMRHGGHWDAPQFSHPRIQQAVDAIGGWRNVCTADMGAMTADRARFIQMFERYEQRERTDRRMLPAVREFVGQRRALTGGGDAAPQLTEGAARVDGKLRELVAGMTK